MATPLPAPPDANALRQAALAGAGDPSKLAGFNDQGFADRIAGLYRNLGTTMGDLDFGDTLAGQTKESTLAQDVVDKGNALDHLTNVLGSRGNQYSSAALKGLADTRGVYDQRDAQANQAYQNALINSARRRQGATDDYSANLGLLQHTLTGDASTYLANLAAQDAQTAEQQRLTSQMIAAMAGSGGGGGGGYAPRAPAPAPINWSQQIAGTPVNFGGSAYSPPPPPTQITSSWAGESARPAVQPVNKVPARGKPMAI